MGKFQNICLSATSACTLRTSPPGGMGYLGISPLGSQGRMADSPSPACAGRLLATTHAPYIVRRRMSGPNVIAGYGPLTHGPKRVREEAEWRGRNHQRSARRKLTGPGSVRAWPGKQPPSAKKG